MGTYTDYVTFHTMTCYKCGVNFGVAQYYYEKRLQDGDWFHCPEGHRQKFCEPEVETLKRALETAKRRADNMMEARDREAEARKHAENSTIAVRGHVTRLKKRIAAGACPCCHKRFPDVAQHMKESHPSYEKDTPRAKS